MSKVPLCQSGTAVERYRRAIRFGAQSANARLGADRIMRAAAMQHGRMTATGLATGSLPVKKRAAAGNSRSRMPIALNKLRSKLQSCWSWFGLICPGWNRSDWKI